MTCLADSRLAVQLGEDLLALVASLGVPLTEVSALHSSDGAAYEATAFRLRFSDQRILKGRRFSTAGMAAEAEYATRHIVHPALPKVIQRRNAAMLTEWIDGRALHDTAYSLDVVRLAGVLQGSLHCVPVPPDAAHRIRKSRDGRRARLHRHLHDLAAAHRLSDDDAARLLRIAQQYEPAHEAMGFVHGDFCAENLVLTPAGEIAVIDNETLSIGAYDYDLARTWYRWPMRAPQRQAWIEGYQRHRATDELFAHFPHWAIIAVLDGLGFRLHARADTLAAPLQRLQDLIAMVESGASSERLLLHL